MFISFNRSILFDGRQENHLQFQLLEDLLKRMSDGTGLNAEFHIQGEQRVIPADWDEGLLRITQESLTNTIKHANARNFRATLSIGLEKVELQLVDDGAGFDAQLEHEGFGLLGMKERVDQMAGLVGVSFPPIVQFPRACLLVGLEHGFPRTFFRKALVISRHWPFEIKPAP